MNGRDKMKEQLFTVLFMLTVSFVFTSGVSIAYLATRSTIEVNEALFLRRAVLYCAGLDVPEDAQELTSMFQARTREIPDDTGALGCYVVMDPESRVATGYVCIERGAGLWGTIVAVIGFEMDRQTLIGIDFVQHNETPGLGARISELWFKEQFRGKRGPFTMVAEGDPAGSNEFDAITGATITSNAVKDIVNRATGRLSAIVDRQ
jgi:Na+-transporting NADH:ubiquinone oxidoreductase subunit C